MLWATRGTALVAAAAVLATCRNVAQTTINDRNRAHTHTNATHTDTSRVVANEVGVISFNTSWRMDHATRSTRAYFALRWTTLKCDDLLSLGVQ